MPTLGGEKALDSRPKCWNCRRRGHLEKDCKNVVAVTEENEDAKRVSAVQCCIIPLHIPACIWLKATGQEAIKRYWTPQLIPLIVSHPSENKR